MTNLRADCSQCVGLCCVAPAFAKSADFAINKPAGHPCPNLQPDFGCGIHQDLRVRGFSGCTVFDCFGAGQKVVQVTFGGRDWRAAPQMFDVFPIVRQLHELLVYLTEALTWAPARSIHGALRSAFDETERLTYGTPDELLALDLATHWTGVNELLLRTSVLVRAGVSSGKSTRTTIDRRGADLIGKDLTGVDFRGANLRGAYLIGANLRGADLRGADLIGADLRGTDLAGADLTGTIFLTQPQVEAAKGDAATKLPSALSRPAHWRS
jgi:hypothetical protein